MICTSFISQGSLTSYMPPSLFSSGYKYVLELWHTFKCWTARLNVAKKAFYFFRSHTCCLAMKIAGRLGVGVLFFILSLPSIWVACLALTWWSFDLYSTLLIWREWRKHDLDMKSQSIDWRILLWYFISCATCIFVHSRCFSSADNSPHFCASLSWSQRDRIDVPQFRMWHTRTSQWCWVTCRLMTAQLAEPILWYVKTVIVWALRSSIQFLWFDRYPFFVLSSWNVVPWNFSNFRLSCIPHSPPRLREQWR